MSSLNAPAFPPLTDRIPLGVAMMLGFCAVGPLIDVAAKMASQSVSITQVTFARMVVQTLLMAPVLAMMGRGFGFSQRQLGWLVGRAFLLIGSTYAFVAAVQVMPIADALAIVFVEPFILLALGYAVFGDQVGPRRIVAALVGFAGALLVIQPNFALFGAVALFPLATAVCFALYILLTRHLSRAMAPEAMQFHTAFLGVLIMLPVLAFGALVGIEDLALSNPPAHVWIELAGVGLAATVAHMLITYALRFAPSATLAPLHYLEILGAVLFGYLFFDDWPNALSWTGIAVISSAGLYIIARERQLARAARRPAP